MSRPSGSGPTHMYTTTETRSTAAEPDKYRSEEGLAKTAAIPSCVSGTRKVRLGKDLMIRVVHNHSQLPESAPIIQIIDTQFMGDLGEFSLEPTYNTLQAMLPEILSSESLQTRVDLCYQLLIGLQILHNAGRPHSSIDPGNIFCVRRENYNSLLLKLGLVGLPSVPTFELVETAPTSKHLNVARLSANDIFSSACVISILISGHHLFGMDHDDQLQNILTGSMIHVSLLERVSLEACDPVRNMIVQQPTIDKCLAHPLFWKANHRLLYISELVRTEKHLHLPTGETLGIGTDWRTQLRSGLLKEFMTTGSSNYGSHPKELLRILRNFYQHPSSFTATEPVRQPLTEAAEELKVFPALFPSLYSIFDKLAGL